MKRVILSSDVTFQAITWEKEDMLISSEEEFDQQLTDLISDLTRSFSDRFQFFINVKETSSNGQKR